ncbi:MAG TPA: hypothetical protein VEC16_05300 [Alphaproteobacteria bacterium]|nr:hypothetical protein [Alphaproteobacteria bacterium]
MVLDFLEGLFRSEEQIQYRKALDSTLKGKIVIGNTLYDLDYLEKAGLNAGMKSPYKKIRKEYYNLFKDLSDKNTLSYQIFDVDIANKIFSPKISFSGHNSNVGFCLEYTKDRSSLTMNFSPRTDYSLLKLDKEKKENLLSDDHGGKGYMNVITLFTQLEADRIDLIVPKTFIHPGDYFTANIAAKPVDDAVAHLFNAARKRKYIPTPDDSEMQKVPHPERYFLHLLDD